MGWSCGIEGCDRSSDDVADLVVHQTRDHHPVSCRVCGLTLPDGYPALRHVLSEHSRAEYVRAYDATAEAVRVREAVAGYLDGVLDLEAVRARIGRR